MRKWFVILAVFCAAGIVLFLLSREQHPAHSADREVDVLHSNASSATIPKTQVSPQTAVINFSSPESNAVAAATMRPSAVTVPPPSPPMPVFTNFAASTVMENMRSVFRQYASTFGGNPVGTNPEITRALSGENPKGVHFINAEDGLRINGNGELVDPWGTPFFFHQLSGTQMEIHSAGPDRVMWTADDLVMK